jgi:hypothetical protein
MGVIGKDFKYKIIKNFLSKDEKEILGIYCEIKHRINLTSFDFSATGSNGDTKYYGDPITDSLLLKKKDLIEKESGKKVLPTYSYWRMYTKNAFLGKHKDRPSCEISVTVSISNDDFKWPIYMDGVPVYLEKGDAVIYLGCDIAHWRERYSGDFHCQTFLHYVDAEGPNKDFYMDKRNFWGTDKV